MRRASRADPTPRRHASWTSPRRPTHSTKDRTMTRVIAGAAGGRRLAVPPGNGTRPTSDRAREGLFSTWDRCSAPLDGAACWTCTRGSGAVGLEALSRGAAPRPARRGRCPGGPHHPGERPGARAARRRGAGRQGRAGRRAAAPDDPYDIVFLDPPYAVTDEDLREILLTLRGQGLACGGGTRHRGAKHRGGTFALAGRVSRRSGPVATARGRFGTVAPLRRPPSRRQPACHDRSGERGKPVAPRRLSGVVRPHHQRTPRHHRPGLQAVRRRSTSP